MAGLFSSVKSFFYTLAAPLRSGPRKRKRDEGEPASDHGDAEQAGVTAAEAGAGATKMRVAVRRRARDSGRRRKKPLEKVGKKMAAAPPTVLPASASNASGPPSARAAAAADLDASLALDLVATGTAADEASAPSAAPTASENAAGSSNHVSAGERDLRPFKRARTSVPEMFRRNTLDIGGSVPPGIMSSPHGRPNAVQYNTHYSIPESTSSPAEALSKNSNPLSLSSSSSSSLYANGALQKWRWLKAIRKRGERRRWPGESKSDIRGRAVAATESVSRNAEPPTPIFSPSGEHLRASEEQLYWQTVSRMQHQEQHQRQQPHPRHTSPSNAVQPETPFANVYAAPASRERHRFSGASVFRGQSAARLPKQYNGGLHLQLPFRSSRRHHIVHDNYPDQRSDYGDSFGESDENGHMELLQQHPQHRYNDFNQGHDYHDGLAEYQAIVREASRLDRNVYQNQVPAREHEAAIKSLRSKVISYKEKRNLPIPRPPPPPNSLLPPQKPSLGGKILDQPAAAVKVVHLDVDSPPHKSEEQSIALASSNGDAVDASDIAEYEAAIASNPNPFGFEFFGVDNPSGGPSVDASALPLTSLQEAASINNNDKNQVGGFAFSFPLNYFPPQDEQEQEPVLADSDGPIVSDGNGRSDGPSHDDSSSSDRASESEEMYSGDDADMLEPEYSARDSLIAPPDVTFDQALTNAEYNLVANTVLAKADPDNVAQISSHSPALFKIPISFKDYHSLTARQWLNDEVIDYYNSLLNMRNREAYDAAVASNAAGGSGPLPPRCYWMKTNFYTFLNDAKEAGYNYSRVKRFTSKRNTKKFGMTDLWNQVDFVFVPINLNRSHWIMGMVNVRDQLFEMYDSMSSGDDQHVQRLQRWVIDEFKKIDKTDTSTPVSQWGIRIPGRDMVPQQRNGFDCGVFSTMFAKWRSQAKDLPFGFDQSNMIHFRHRMALDIWQHEMAGSS